MSAEYFPLPDGRRVAEGIVADPEGNVWFLATDVSSGAVGRLAGVVGAPPSTPDARPPAGDTTVKATASGVARVGEVIVKGTDVWANQICVGPPQDRCSLVYLLDAHEYVTGFPGTRPRPAAASGKRKTRRLVIGRRAVTIPGGKSAKVKISLNAKGKAILRRDGVLHLTFHATQKVSEGKKKVSKTLKSKKLTIRAPK